MIEHKVYEIKGLKCANCSQTVNSSLKLARGVKQVAANHEAGTLEIDYDGDVTNPEAIKAIVDGLGFEMQL